MMMSNSFKKMYGPVLLFMALFSMVNTAKSQELTLKVLQLNIWQEGTQVPGGYEAIVDEIARLKPDLVTLSEVRNYKNTKLNKRLLKSLAGKGETYFSFFSNGSGVLSKSPILDSTLVYKDKGSIYRLLTKIGGREVALYSAHLDYENYAVYLPRGYSGSTWKKLPAPVLDKKAVLEDNLASKRDEAIGDFLNHAKEDLKAGRLVFLGGDFNEASHLDWTKATKDKFDHNGMVIPWQNSLTLYKNGFKDSYRELHPNPVSHPGFTFPAGNPAVAISKLTWAPEVDERDRIDFIYYHPDHDLHLIQSSIVGPKTSIVKSKMATEEGDDNFIEPLGVWPTDHKGVMTVFKLKKIKSQN